MKGTDQFCRTKEAVKRLKAGDIIQHLKSEEYYQQMKDAVYCSDDMHSWVQYPFPMELFPPFDEWRSISNLHYYADLKKEYGDEPLFYLDEKNTIIKENATLDKTCKRWFRGVDFI